VAFVVGYVVITWLMAFIKKRSFMPFVVYRLALGALILVLVGTGALDRTPVRRRDLVWRRGNSRSASACQVHGQRGRGARRAVAGVELDESVAVRPRRFVERLTDVPLAEIVCSPLQRCRQTVTPLAGALGAGTGDRGPAVRSGLRRLDRARAEGTCSRRKLWSVVQQHPSAAVFPDGEGLATVQDQGGGRGPRARRADHRRTRARRRVVAVQPR